jgi:hypothetical protein
MCKGILRGVTRRYYPLFERLLMRSPVNGSGERETHRFETLLLLENVAFVYRTNRVTA